MRAARKTGMPLNEADGQKHVSDWIARMATLLQNMIFENKNISFFIAGYH